jgi:hypothetical protein
MQTTKTRTLLSTVAILALSCSFATAQSRQQDEDRNAPRATAPSTTQQQTAPSTGQTQRPPSGAAQNSQSAPSSAQSTQQPAPSGNTQRAQQPGANQNSQATQAPSAQQPQQRSTQSPAPSTQQGAQQQQQQQPQQRSTQSPAPSTQQGAQNQQAAPNRAAQGAATTPQQRTQITAAIRQQNVSPVRVNFNVAVGVTVPSNVRLAVLPDTIVAIVPQYRGYSYFVTEERIVIVEPSSHRVVEVLPFEGSGRAAAAPAPRKAQFTKEQRASIKKHATTKQRVTTGSGTTRRYVVDEEVPRDVELEEFDEVVVRDVPTVREYRYIRRDNDVVVVDPGSRRVLDIID